MSSEASAAFRRFLLLGAATAILFGATACSLYEGPPPPRKKEIQGLGCLKDFGARLDDYFNGKGSRDDLNRLADCSVQAVQAFQDVVRGESRDVFTAEEIRNFLQRYFLEDITISDAFLHDLMRVKQAFLGGKITDFSREDLKSAESMIRTFQSVFVRLQPYMPITLDRMKTESEAYVDDAGRALSDAAGILGQKITELDSVYKIAELENLLDEFNRSFPAQAASLRPIRDNLKIAGRLKEILVSPYGDRDRITAREWKFVLQDGSRWFAIFSKFLNMQTRYSDWTRGDGRIRLTAAVSETIDLLERATARHCPVEKVTPKGCAINPGIPLTSIQELIDESAWNGEIGGIKFRKSTLRDVLPVVIRRILGGTDFSETGRTATRLTREHFERLRGLFQEWIDGTRYVEGAFLKLGKDSKFGSGRGFATKEITALAPSDVLRANGGVTEEAVATAEELRTTFDATASLGAGTSASVLYDGKNAIRPRSYAELERYTWLRPLLKRVVMGYVQESHLASAPPKGLDLTEFTGFITDYWQILLDFSFVGPSNHPDTDAQKRMREASLFNQASDGDSILSVDEGVQLILLMLSADPMNRSAHDRIAKLCKNGDLDEWDEPTIEPECYRREFYDFSAKDVVFADLWKSFPLLLKFYDGLDDEKRGEFNRYVEIVSRKKGYQEKVYFDSSDTQSTMMLFHYVEQLYQRFDENGDGFINEAEAEKAFPVFRPTLANLANLDPNGSRVKKVFFWLLANGSPPVSDDMNHWQKIWHGVGFLFWSWYGPEFHADRLAFMKVFAALSSSSNAAPAPTPSGSPPGFAQPGSSSQW